MDVIGGPAGSSSDSGDVVRLTFREVPLLLDESVHIFKHFAGVFPIMSYCTVNPVNAYPAYSRLNELF